MIQRLRLLNHQVILFNQVLLLSLIASSFMEYQVVLFDDLALLQSSVDMRVLDAEFMEEGACVLSLAVLVLVVAAVLGVHKDLADHLLHFIILLEQLRLLDGGAALDRDSGDLAETEWNWERKIRLVVFLVQHSHDFTQSRHIARIWASKRFW